MLYTFEEMAVITNCFKQRTLINTQAGWWWEWFCKIFSYLLVRFLHFLRKNMLQLKHLQHMKNGNSKICIFEKWTPFLRFYAKMKPRQLYSKLHQKIKMQRSFKNWNMHEHFCILSCGTPISCYQCSPFVWHFGLCTRVIVTESRPTNTRRKQGCRINHSEGASAPQLF